MWQNNAISSFNLMFNCDPIPLFRTFSSSFLFWFNSLIINCANHSQQLIYAMCFFNIDISYLWNGDAWVCVCVHKNVAINWNSKAKSMNWKTEMITATGTGWCCRGVQYSFTRMCMQRLVDTLQTSFILKWMKCETIIMFN